MTQPDGFIPSGAANFASLAAFAAKTQTDWENDLTAAEVARWGDILSGMFGGMGGGQSFILTLITELCKQLLGLDPTTFFANLEDAWNSLAEWANDIWAKSAEQWAAIGTQLNALWTLVTGGPVSAAAWATWWSNFLIALGVDGISAASIANFLSGNYDAAITAKANWTAFMAAWGIGTPADVATAAANSKAQLAAFLASIGLGSMTAAGAQLASNNTSIADQLAWWARLAEDLWIQADLFHLFYPVGSPSDTATTTSGGKRTWYSSQADLKLLYTAIGNSPPTVTPVSPGDVINANTAAANTAASNASLAIATNQDLTNKIIASQTGVEPTTGTAADAQNALENIPASNIAGQTGALVTYGATGSVAGAGPGTFSGNNSGTMTFTPLSTDTTLDIIVTYYGGQSSTRTITADVGGVPLALVNHVAGNAYGSNVPEIAVYRLTLTPSGSPPTITVNINVASTNGNSYWSAVGISYYGIKVSYSAVYNGAIGTNTTTPVSMTRNSDNNKRIFQVLTHVSNGTVTRTLTGGGTQRVNFSGSTPAIFIQDIQGAAAPGVTTLSCNLVTGAGISGSWAGMLVEISN